MLPSISPSAVPSCVPAASAPGKRIVGAHEGLVVVIVVVAAIVVVVVVVVAAAASAAAMSGFVVFGVNVWLVSKIELVSDKLGL